VYARPATGDTLGVSGMLWRDALIMYDRTTKSLWSQINGKAVAGPMKGRRLEEIPSELTTWGEWKRRHPQTLVLEKPAQSGSFYEEYFVDPNRIGVRGATNPEPRLSGKTLVLGLERHERFAAVPLQDIESKRLLNTSAFNIPIVMTLSSAYERGTLIFEAADAATIRDRETGSRWSVETGAALDGPMRGKQLQRISTKIVYWGVWARFHPNSELIVH